VSRGNQGQRCFREILYQIKLSGERGVGRLHVIRPNLKQDILADRATAIEEHPISNSRAPLMAKLTLPPSIRRATPNDSGGFDIAIFSRMPLFSNI
jgi:hypothetical protein